MVVSKMTDSAEEQPTSPPSWQQARTQASLVWDLVDFRQQEGGRAWDEKVLSEIPKKRIASHGRRSPKGRHSPGRDRSSSPGQEEWEEAESLPEGDPPPEIGNREREKPEPPARVRRRFLQSVTAQYMPKYRQQEDDFKTQAAKLAETTGFSIEKVRRLCREFQQYARPAHSADPDVIPNLDMFTFSKLMAKHKVDNKALLLRLFNMYDKRREGTIVFKDYVDILAVFKSMDRKVQANALFQMCDVDGDRRLGKIELLKFINQDVEKEKRVVVSAILDELIELLGCDTVSEISYSAFMESVSTDDTVWRLFRALSPFTRLIDKNGGEILLQKTIV